MKKNNIIYVNGLIDLAQSRLGSKIVYKTDEFFAPAKRIINPQPPVFKEEEFDAVLCGYSLRDAINLRIAISEIHRVLKKDGRMVIVDLGKPDESFFRIGVSFYLRCILPILAFSAAGKLGLKFGTLYGTYKRWPQNKKLEELLLEKSLRILPTKTSFLPFTVIGIGQLLVFGSS